MLPLFMITGSCDENHSGFSVQRWWSGDALVERANILGASKKEECKNLVYPRKSAMFSFSHELIVKRDHF